MYIFSDTKMTYVLKFQSIEQIENKYRTLHYFNHELSYSFIQKIVNFNNNLLVKI